MKKIARIMTLLLVLSLGLSNSSSLSAQTTQTTKKADCSHCHKQPAAHKGQCNDCYMQLKMGAVEGKCSMCKKSKLLSNKGKGKGMCFHCYQKIRPQGSSTTKYKHRGR